MPTSDCPALFTVPDFILGIVIAGFTPISFIPQHLKLIRLKSTAGISFQWVIISCVSCTALFLNFFATEYQNIFQCCFDDTVQCIGNTLGFLQACGIYFSNHLILFLYLIYHKQTIRKGTIHTSSSGEEIKRVTGEDFSYSCQDAAQDPKKPLLTGEEDQVDAYGGLKYYSWEKVLWWTLATWLFELAMAGALVVMVLTSSSRFASPSLEKLGLFLLVINSSCAVVKWAPQLYRTCRDRAVGSLSLLMLFIQAGGAAMSAYFQSINAQFYIWAPLAIQSVLITILFVIGVFFTDNRRRILAFFLRSNNDTPSK